MAERVVATTLVARGIPAYQARMSAAAQANMRFGASAAAPNAAMGTMAGRARGVTSSLGLLNPKILGPAGLVVGLQRAMSAQSSFMDDQIKLRTQIGLTADETDYAAESARAVGTAWGIGGQEAIEASFFIHSAGLRGADATEALEAAAKGAALGLGETKDIADLTTAAVNAYGSDVLGASEATDILLAAVREGKAEAPEFAAAMGQVLPIASELGVSFDEMAGAVAAMTRTGTNPGTATVQLRQMLMGLLNPTEQAREALDSVGLSAEGLREQLRSEGLMSVLQTLRESFQGNSEAMSEVFGNARSLMGVLDLVGANADENAAIIERMGDALGLVDEGMQVVEETSLSFQWSKLKAHFHDLAHGAGALNDGLRETIGFLNDILGHDQEGREHGIGGGELAGAGFRDAASVALAGMTSGLFGDAQSDNMQQLVVDAVKAAAAAEQLAEQQATLQAIGESDGYLAAIGAKGAEQAPPRLEAAREAALRLWDTLEEGEDAWQSVASSMLDASQAMSRAHDENREAAEEAAEAHNAAIDDQIAKLKDGETEQRQSLQEQKKNWEDFAAEAVTIEQVTRHLEDINQEFRDWQGDLQTIAGRAGGGVATRLGMMGEEWAPIVAQAVDASAEELARLDQALVDNMDLHLAAAEMAVQMEVLEEVVRQGSEATVDSVSQALGVVPEVVADVFGAIGHPSIQVDADIDPALAEFAEARGVADELDRLVVIATADANNDPALRELRAAAEAGDEWARARYESEVQARIDEAIRSFLEANGLADAWDRRVAAAELSARIDRGGFISARQALESLAAPRTATINVQATGTSSVRQRIAAVTGSRELHEGGWGHEGRPRSGPLAGNEHLRVLRDDEFVVNPQASRTHAGLLEAINAGMSPSHDPRNIANLSRLMTANGGPTSGTSPTAGGVTINAEQTFYGHPDPVDSFRAKEDLRMLAAATAYG